MKATPFNSIPLHGWTFKQGDRSSDKEWLGAGDPPTEVHRDLARHGKAPDYRQDLNELAVRWIGDETWTYRTTFGRPAEEHGQDGGIKAVLNFEGLDTFAKVYLNDSLILSSDNMFLQHRVEVTSKLTDENTLEIEFESARLKGLELVKQHPEHRFIVHQTEISRGPVRKAQYHWGWDWGPILMTCGPTKPITLETYTCRLDNLHVRYELSTDLKAVKGSVQLRHAGEGELSVELVNNRTGTIEWSANKLQQVGSGTEPNLYEAPFELHEVQLWWPRGYGAQSMYTVRAVAQVANGEGSTLVLHSISQTTGFRHVELVQEPDAHGQSFYFRINHVDVFVGGSCWIPIDNELSRHHPSSDTSSSSYRDWVQLAAEGNQTMIRVWGGGVYEPDAFYAAADELGVLVWQDFMFACANYPADPGYQESVYLEARQNVRRIRHHPSVVIWAGNNEDYQIVERYGLQYDVEDKDPESLLKTDFPARYLYEYLLPKVVKMETMGVPYHPSSPFGNGKSTVLKVDPTIGDVHQWNVWHGTMQPYQQLPEMGGRFVSEFGMEGYPHLDTLEKCITRPEDRHPGSMSMDFRNKAIGHSRRLLSYVSENFRLRQDLEGFAHLTQVMQADALAIAYRAWRRQWGSNEENNRKCGGVLVWQLNDCWPTVSWAVVDYHGVPKPAYYAIKRAMRPVAVGVQRRFRDWTMRPSDELWQRDTSHIDMRSLWEDVRFDVWVASNGQLACENARLTVQFISVKTGNEVAQALVKEVAVGTLNGTDEIIRNATVDVPDKQDSREPYDTSKADPFVIHATLHIDDRLVSSDCSWPDPIKYLAFPDRGVKVNYPNKSTAVVTADKPVKGFVFSEVSDVLLDDNGFDIMPGEERRVTMKAKSDYSIGRLKWRYVEMD
ncbi:enoyl hydratase [Apiospora arundinis]